jgi:Tol biopolymer transport system component/predicted Ser/Thr protein kinase
MTGTTLSHYEILDEISRGGMGIVYRARDTRLNRDVALKVLPPELVADVDRKRRFVQEAQAAASLSHPHIAVVYEIGEWQGVTFIAMELIDGQTLSEVLMGRPLSIRRALELTSEIAEGLARAHEKNIVHRDIKPANIMVTSDRHAKIIDFGLAKLVEPLSHDSQALTIADNTATGVVLGTTAYMSPEQARGDAVDHRTDIFSLGVVVFEMIDGRRPFDAQTPIETLNAILTVPAPPVRAVAGGSARAADVQRVVHRCLEKDPEDRYQTARDLCSELRRVRRDSESGANAPFAPRVRPAPHVLWMAAAGVAVVLTALIMIYGWPFNRSPDSATVRLTNPQQLTSAEGAEWFPTWSPEGTRVAYMHAGDIWITQLGGASMNLTPEAANGSFPSWSPDGTQIAFASQQEGPGYYVVSALGGRPRRILAATGDLGRPVWSHDGSRLAGVTPDASGQQRLEIVTLQSMQSTSIPLAGRETWRTDLTWSSNDQLVAYVDAVSSTPDVTQLWVVRLADGHATALTDGMTLVRTPSFSADSRTVFYVSNDGGSFDLWRQSLAADGTAMGEPQRLTTGVGMSTAALSADGTRLAYSRGLGRVANVWRVPVTANRRVTWADARQLTTDEAFVEFIDVSPDGSELFVSSNRRGNQDIWRMPAAGGEMQQVTSHPAPDWRPSISADGTQLVFYSYRSGNRDIWVMPRAGGPARQVTTHEGGDFHPVWSPDGSRIAFASSRSGVFNIMVVAASGGEPTAVATNPGDNVPSWSPDGRWIAFSRDTPEGPRVFRVPAGGGQATPLTRGRGSFSRWSRDGKALHYLRASQIWETNLETGVERQLTEFAGKAGNIGIFGLATDGTYLYFTWQEARADLWTMEVAR